MILRAGMGGGDEDGGGRWRRGRSDCLFVHKADSTGTSQSSCPDAPHPAPRNKVRRTVPPKPISHTNTTGLDSIQVYTLTGVCILLYIHVQFPITLSVRLSVGNLGVGLSVCHHFKLNFPCSYRGTFLLIFTLSALTKEC